MNPSNKDNTTKKRVGWGDSPKVLAFSSMAIKQIHGDYTESTFVVAKHSFIP